MKSCPACGHPHSSIESRDGDYWRVCQWCGTATKPCSSAKAATAAWDDRSQSPKAESSTTANRAV